MRKGVAVPLSKGLKYKRRGLCNVASKRSFVKGPNGKLNNGKRENMLLFVIYLFVIITNF